MNMDSINLNRMKLIGVKSSAPIFQDGKDKKAEKAKEKDFAEASPGESINIRSSLFKSVLPGRSKPKYTEQKALKNDQYELQDGYDSSRDIAGVHSLEGNPNEPYKFRVKLTNLRPGAGLGNLDVYTLISLGKGQGQANLPDDIPGKVSQPWNLAVGKYDQKNFKAVDEHGNLKPDAVSNVKFDSVHNQVEFGVNKHVLREMGWKDGEPLKLNVFTTKDFVKQVTDSLDEPSKKPWVNDGNMTHYMDTSNPQSIRPKRDDNWADDIIYFLLTDRFEDGDTNNNMGVDKDNLVKYHGGDLQGVINRMDYMKDLGVSTIWVTPVFDSQDEFIDSAGYHGYWPVDLQKVDEHLGDKAKFKEMVDLAHKKDMKVILDVPLNHVAWEHPFWKDPKKQDWFHHIGDIEDWNDPHQIENGSMYGLPDLAQENPEVYDYLIDTCKSWIDDSGVDGFRLDAVMHVNRSFWDKFSKDIKEHAGPDFYMVGEVFHGDPKKVGAYQSDGMPGMFDMPLYFTSKEVFAHDGSMKSLAYKMSELEASYENPSMMAAFLDNHDTARFLTEAGHNGREKLKLALAFLMSINRIPVIYYGTEQSMEGREEHMGSHGPENRADMQFGKDPDMQAYFTQLAKARANSPALREGALLEMWRDDKVYAYSRLHTDDEAIVVLNNSYDDQYREIPLRKESEITNGTVMKDVVTGQEYTIQDSKLKVRLRRKQPLVLVKKDG
ncbi:MAG: cyclomaltodextrinase C-terminal domain-containing protein [Candidatus Eremiobacteraeota bacterium]|nr:cyclomaltodextrinase C-terminal domain-containing protein [Candidatus Eremiobacteraeota bacterium]